MNACIHVIEIAYLMNSKMKVALLHYPITSLLLPEYMQSISDRYSSFCPQMPRLCHVWDILYTTTPAIQHRLHMALDL